MSGDRWLSVMTLAAGILVLAIAAVAVGLMGPRSAVARLAEP